MSIAVVILNWNGKALLEKFLPSVVAYSKEATIYLADNASTDHSITFIKANYPDIKIIKNKENGGFAKGYNDALREVEEDIYCLLNSDVEVTEGWLNEIVSEFKMHTKTSIIQPKILDYKNKNLFEYAGAAGGFIDKYGFPYCRGRIFNTIEEDNSQYNDVTQVFWASGACFFIRKSVFKELNGFDELFFAHMEEIDLCWRAFNKNYHVKYVSSSVVYHVGGATLDSNSPKKTYLNFRNSLFMLVKNLPKGELISTLFIRLLLDGIAGLKFLVEFKPSHFIAVLKAHLVFYFNLPRAIKNRKPTSNTMKYYQKKSIVWLYFVNKKRYFNSL